MDFFCFLVNLPATRQTCFATQGGLVGCVRQKRQFVGLTQALAGGHLTNNFQRRIID